MSVERLTERHFKKADGFYMECSEHCSKEDFSCEDCAEFERLVDRLGEIEEILGGEYDLDRLRELVEADRDGRCKIIPVQRGRKCGACKNFRRIPGTLRGKCELKQYQSNRYGMVTNWEFEPSQSRIACKKYVQKSEAEGDSHADQG